MKTLKVALSVVLATLVTTGGIYWVVKRIDGDQVAMPGRITSAAVCPVAGCSARACHAAAPPPALTAGQTMRCPKVGCQASVCHARDRLTSHYHTPKGASLDLWILGLSVFTIAMVLIAFYV